MLARLVRPGRRGAPLLRRALHGSTAVLGDSEDDADGRKAQEAPMVFSRASGSTRELRYYVLKDQHNPALNILEQAISGAPIPSWSGKKPRFFSIPAPGVCNSLLVKAAEDHTQAGKAAEIAESLLAAGTPLEAHTLKALIHSLAKADELPTALPLLDAWLQQQEEALEEDANTQGPLQVMSLLMDTATRAENTQMVLQVLARMARIGVLPSPQSLTTLLQCFMRLGQVQVAHSVLDWMRRNNLEPNVYSYTALLALPRNLNEANASELLAQARSAYDKMWADGVEPNARFFTEYIRICGRAGSMQAAEEAWGYMGAAGVEPDLILYSAMIDTCAKCRAPEAAMRVFADMKSRGLQPDVVAYTSLLTALQGAPQAASLAREVWAGMRADRVQPNGMAVAAFLEILLLEGEVDEALQTLAAAQPGSQGSRGERPRGRGARARQRTPWAVKSAEFLEAAGLEEESQQVQWSREGQGSEGEAVDLHRLYEHFLFAMAHKGQYAVVEQMARHMRARGLPHTLGTASALLTAQALQHGNSNAKWLLQPFPASQQHSAGGGGSSSGGGGGSAGTVQLPDEAVESCLLGRGSPQSCMEKLMRGLPAPTAAADKEGSGASSSGGGRGSSSAGNGSGGGSSIRPTITTANIVLAGLAVRGHTADAVRLFDWMKQQQRQGEQQGEQGGSQISRQQATSAAAAACAPDWWTHQLLLFAALNAPREQQLELTLRAVKEAREFTADSGGNSGGPQQRRGRRSGGPGWDGRTRSAIAAVMRQSEQARALLGAGLADAAAAAEEREEQLQQLRGLLS